jgi:hypothetical protein
MRHGFPVARLARVADQSKERSEAGGVGDETGRAVVDLHGLEVGTIHSP